MSRLLVPVLTDWFALHFNVQEQLQIQEYQMYAVEKWIVERDKPVTVLTVYTGDPAHKITVTALSPKSLLDWDHALHLLRRDGAKPKHTPHGLLMATSLAHFRSDYTIVNIPNGYFTPVRDHLYANINLLRMGCSGRSALALDEPSDSTKDRFISAYHFPDSTSSDPTVRAKTKDRAAFTATVLELVKLLQAGLAIFGMYANKDSSVPQNLVLDGLLCDKTVDGIRRWIAEIGEPCVALEPTERTADPMFVAALLSLLISIRNKLSALGYSNIVPKDPFLYPYAFSIAVMAYVHTSAPPSIGTPATVFTAPYDPPSSTPPLTVPLQSLILTRDLIESIELAYEKSRLGDNKRVRRALKGKLEDLAGVVGANSEGDDRDWETGNKDTRDRRATLSGNEQEPMATTSNPLPSTSTSGIGSSGNRVLGNIGSLLSSAAGGGAPGGAGSVMGPTTSLVGFLGVVMGKEREAVKRTGGKKSREEKRERKEKTGSVDLGVMGIGMPRKEKEGVVAGSVKALWSGRVGELVKMRTDWEVSPVEYKRTHSHTGSLANDKWVNKRHTLGVHSDNDIEDRHHRSDGRSTEAEEDSEGVYATAASTATGPTAGTFGSRVKGKLGSWAVLGRKKGYGYNSQPGSVDLTHLGAPPSAAPGGSVRSASGAGSMGSGSLGGSISRRSVMKEADAGNFVTPPRLVIGPGTSSVSKGNNKKTGVSRRSTMGSQSGPQSPTLPPMVFADDREGEFDDDEEMLSSGQVSPLSDYRPNPFNVLHSGHSVGSSTSNLNNLNFNNNMNHLSPYPYPHTSHTTTSTTSFAPNLTRALTRDYGKLQPTSAGSGSTPGFPPKRPWTARRLSSTRVSSWADPISAKYVLDEGDEAVGEEGSTLIGGEDDDVLGLGQGGEDSDVSELRRGRDGFSSNTSAREREKTRFHSMLSVADWDGVRSIAEEPLVMDLEDGEWEMGEEDMWKRRRRVVCWLDPMRRRSFHDLEAYQDMPVLSPERMRVDVEVCGQVLVMTRRQEHLKNVIACIQILNADLASTNTLLRQQYESNLPNLSSIETRTKVLAQLDNQNLIADKLSQATNTLRYEAQQFDLPDLWHAASLSRQKVFSLRDKVFGSSGGRKLPPGVHGAHGRFNRLQKTPDGRERVVDYLGRTESEVDEEERVDPEGMFVEPVEEDGDEEDVVENPNIRPIWLLRFFMGWGARWSAAAPAVSAQTLAASEQVQEGQKDGGALEVKVNSKADREKKVEHEVVDDRSPISVS